MRYGAFRAVVRQKPPLDSGRWPRLRLARGSGWGARAAVVPPGPERVRARVVGAEFTRMTAGPGPLAVVSPRRGIIPWGVSAGRCGTWRAAEERTLS